jgi:hypothetical protein
MRMLDCLDFAFYYTVLDWEDVAKKTEIGTVENATLFKSPVSKRIKTTDS